MKAILTLAGELAAGKTTSQALVEDALLRIAVPSGKGARVFLCTHRESALEDDQLYARTNRAILRNPSVVNFLDGCALSIPCHQQGQGPVGLMVVGQCGEDRRLLALGLALESALRQ